MRHQKDGRVYRLFCLISMSLFFACGQPESVNDVQNRPVAAEQSASTAPAAKWSPSFGEAPLGYVDATPRAVAQGTDLRFSGWAVDGRDGAPVKTITVMVDGKPAATASLGFPRPDVAATLGRPAMRRSGWIAIVSTAALPAGQHTYSVTAENSHGRKQTLAPVGDSTIEITRP